MKKRRIIKSIFASMLAIMMVLSLTSIVSAADTATLTINNTVAGKTVDLYQVFSAKKALNGAVIYTLNGQYESFFTDATDNKYGCSGKEGQTLSDAAYKYVANLSDNGKVNFAKEILKWSLETSEINKYKGSIDTTALSTTISNIDYGFYLVYLKGASDTTTSITGVTEYSPAILVNVTDPNVDINMKSSYPTVDKTIDNENHGEAAIGDKITYTLTSYVPDMTGYSSYIFRFKDTLSEGLTFNSDSVTLSIDNTTITNGTDLEDKYSVNNTTGDDGKTIVTIELKDFIKYANKVGQSIVVTYTATLNEKALVGKDANDNSAVIEYSNDPSDETKTDTSTPDIVPVYSFDFIINKYHIDEAGQKTALSGAKFKLYKDQNCADNSEIKLAEVSAGDATDNDAVYRVAKTDENGVDAISPANGKIHIKGLDANVDYYLKETEPPTNYNPLFGPIKITIVPTYTDDKLASYKAEYIYNDITSESDNTKNSAPIINVENKTGKELPNTGGMGTVIFTVGGLAIIGIMVGFSVMSKKKKKM